MKSVDSESLPKGWREVKLEDIGEFRGGVTSIGVDDYGYGTPFISYLNVYDNSKVDINSLELMNVPSGDIERLKCQYGDIFFTSSSEVKDEVAMSSVLLESVDNLTFNGFCKRFRLKTFDNLLPEYARYLFRSPAFRNIIRVKVTGNTRFNINQHELKKIVIPVPPLPEQKAIASFLEKWDEVNDKALETIEQLIVSTEKQLQGLQVSLLYPSEPLPEGWSIVELGDVTEIKRGTTMTKKETTKGNIPVIAGGQKAAYYHNKSNREENTITVSGSGAYAGFVNYFNEPIFASDCSTIRTNDESNALIDFVYRTLKGKQEEIYKLQKGMAQPHVYLKDLQNFKILLPPPPEQKAIVAQLEEQNKVWQEALSKYRELKEKYILQKQVSHTKLLNGEWRLNYE